MAIIGAKLCFALIGATLCEGVALNLPQGTTSLDPCLLDFVHGLPLVIMIAQAKLAFLGLSFYKGSASAHRKGIIPLTLTGERYGV